MAETRTRMKNAREKARAVVKKEIEIQKKRESLLTDLFAGLDLRDEADENIGVALASLQEFGESKQALRDVSGLDVKEVTQLIELVSGEPETNDDSSGASDEVQQGSEQHPHDGEVSDDQ